MVPSSRSMATAEARLEKVTLMIPAAMTPGTRICW